MGRLGRRLLREVRSLLGFLQGQGLRSLADLGHSSMHTTERYTQLEVSDLRKVVQRCHPREGWQG